MLAIKNLLDLFRGDFLDNIRNDSGLVSENFF